MSSAGFWDGKVHYWWPRAKEGDFSTWAGVQISRYESVRRIMKVWPWRNCLQVSYELAKKPSEEEEQDTTTTPTSEQVEIDLEDIQNEIITETLILEQI